jgi:hypothetical protein
MQNQPARLRPGTWIVRIAEVVDVVGVVSVVAAIARAEAEVAELAVGEVGLKLRAWRRGSALLDSKSSILLIVARGERGGDDGDREEE